MQPCSNMAEAGPCTRKPHHPTVVGVGDDKLVVRRWASDKRPIPWSHTARLSIGDVFPEMQKTSRSEVDGPTHFLVLDVKCLGGVPGTCWSGVEWSGVEWSGYPGYLSSANRWKPAVGYVGHAGHRRRRRLELPLSEQCARVACTQRLRFRLRRHRNQTLLSMPWHQQFLHKHHSRETF